jgi:hypothetical protein
MFLCVRQNTIDVRSNMFPPMAVLLESNARRQKSTINEQGERVFGGVCVETKCVDIEYGIRGLAYGIGWVIEQMVTARSKSVWSAERMAAMPPTLSEKFNGTNSPLPNTFADAQTFQSQAAGR